MQMFFPTALEKAQLQSVLETLALNRRRLASDEQRYENDRRDRRENYLQEQEVRERAQAKAIEANRNLEEHRQALARWPLDSLPTEIVRASKAFTSSDTTAQATRPPLNVIVKLTSGAHRGAAASPLAEVEGQLLSQIATAVTNARGRVSTYFGNDLLFYDTHFDPRKGIHRGDSLLATVYNGLCTEPSALIEIFVAQFSSVSAPATIGFCLFSWSWASAPAPNNEPNLRQVEREPILYLDVDPKSADASKTIEAALLMIVTGLRDGYRTMRSLLRPSPVLMFHLLKDVPAITFWKRTSAWNDREMLSGARLLLESHTGLLGSIADRAPMIAAEASAQSALDAYAVGFVEQADNLLGRSLEYYHAAITPETDEEGLLRYLAEAQRGTSEMVVWRALQDLRGITVPSPSKEIPSPDFAVMLELAHRHAL
jgi:hypothetical protein